jgi:hypothetical protein
VGTNTFRCGYKHLSVWVQTPFGVGTNTFRRGYKHLSVWVQTPFGVGTIYISLIISMTILWLKIFKDILPYNINKRQSNNGFAF